MTIKEFPNYGILDDGLPQPCGAIHPTYGVTCVRYGRCWGGTLHMGIITNPRRLPDEQRKFVYWGGASMEADGHVR